LIYSAMLVTMPLWSGGHVSDTSLSSERGT
jgi:hypothetical protein